MTTHLFPVAETEAGARQIAVERLRFNQDIPWWEIRRGYDGYYVVPPAYLGQGRWGVDAGYESLGNYVGRESRLSP